MTADPANLLAVQQVSKALNVSTRTVQRLIDQGEIAVIRIGRTVRIHPNDLASFIKLHRSGSVR